MSERRRFRGCGVGLGRLGFAGGLVRGSAASLGPIGRFRFGVKLTRGFHLNAHGAGCTTGLPPSVFLPGSRPGRGARIPRAVLAGEGGLLGGYGGCGCPGQGLGCAESLPGVPRLYGSSMVLQDVKIIIVYQKRKALCPIQCPLSPIGILVRSIDCSNFAEVG